MRHIFSTLAVVFVLGFGFSSIMAAQQPRDVPAQSVNTVDDVRRDGRDWGWLGLGQLEGGSPVWTTFATGSSIPHDRRPLHLEQIFPDYHCSAEVDASGSDPRLIRHL
jgi:hypothetical protein